MDYKHLLVGLVGPLGIVGQWARSQGMKDRWVIIGEFVTCLFLYALATNPEDPMRKTFFEGLLWIGGSFGTVYGITMGVATGSYQIAARGSNDDERKKIASLPVVLVTNPDKHITK